MYGGIKKRWYDFESTVYFIYFFNLFFYFILFLGLRCGVQAFSSCSKLGLLFIVVRRLLIEVVSLVVEHRL